MANGEWLLERGETTSEVEPIQQALVETFRDVEAISPVLMVREVNDSGQVAFVNRPMLPVAQTEYPIKEVIKDAHSSIPGVIAAIAIVTKLPKSMIIGPGQSREVVAARHAAMYLARETVLPQPSYPEIGKEFNRDHTTAMSAAKGIETLLLSYDPDPKAAARKRNVSAIIERASKVIEQGYRGDDEDYVVREIGKTDNIVCLCPQGLVASPILNLKDQERRRLAMRIPSKVILDKVILDWERASQTPQIYRRFGDAAFKLARNRIQEKQKATQI